MLWKFKVVVLGMPLVKVPTGLKNVGFLYPFVRGLLHNDMKGRCQPS